ncbi:uncharacterized protein [Chironomus tepperi]|uniref:uncharacterized protein n=1 Tax=Chironomus tepperi TaxID=113505 RepID=UPI00391F07BF
MLKNLNGFEYHVPIYHQPPLVLISKDNKVTAPMIYFFKAVESAQNSKFKLIILDDMQPFYDKWANRKMDLSINTALPFTMLEPKLFSYDKKSFCALIPNPSIKSTFQLVITKPFNGIIWFYCGMSVIGSVAVWRMYRGRGAVDSHCQLAVGIFMMFIGQGSHFSRQNRFVLAVLLNIICLSVFLLSNMYGTVITSFMIQPAQEYRLKTVDDLIASDYQILSNHPFEYSIRNSSLVKTLASKTVPEKFASDGEKKLIEQRYVIIRNCHKAKIVLSEKLTNGRPGTDYYYLLPEELSWTHVQLEASYQNPFIEQFQYFMDLSFQAGLPQMWKVFVSQDYAEYENLRGSDKKVDKKLLVLDDLWCLFVVWSIGLNAAVVVLFIEIFCHDCLGNLRVKEAIKEVFNRMLDMLQIRRNKHKLKVRSIVVRPVNVN